MTVKIMKAIEFLINYLTKIKFVMFNRKGVNVHRFVILKYIRQAYKYARIGQTEFVFFLFS